MRNLMTGLVLGVLLSGSVHAPRLPSLVSVSAAPYVSEVEFPLDLLAIMTARSNRSVTNCGQLATALIAAEWPMALVPTMVAIAHAESGCGTDAIYRAPFERSVGPLQLNLRQHPWVGEWCAKDFICASRAALRIYHWQGLPAWAVYRSGQYRQFLEMYQ